MKVFNVKTFQVRESPAPLKIPTLTPAPDQGGPVVCLGGPVAQKPTKTERTHDNIEQHSKMQKCIRLPGFQSDWTMPTKANYNTKQHFYVWRSSLYSLWCATKTRKKTRLNYLS